MTENYFNYQQYVADSAWERRQFWRKWWSLQQRDKRWTPPHFATLGQMQQPHRAQHLARAAPLYMRMEGLPRRGSSQGIGAGSDVFETTLATALLLVDPQRTDQVAYLSHFHTVNDLESLETFFYFMMERLWEQGVRKAIGPCIASPHLQCGALVDSFHRSPPLHTPYNPPYLPELLQGTMRPIEERRLYSIDVDSMNVAPLIHQNLPELAQPNARGLIQQRGPAQLSALDPLRLARSLLPLFQAACNTSELFHVPDSVEAEFLLRQITQTPTLAWVARVHHQPVGFILLQPDVSAILRRARGGRNLLWRGWLRWRSKRAVTAGRLLYGAVLPAWRRRGIGQQLLMQALLEATRRGWHSLTIGPLPDQQPAVTFLQERGAKPVQRYQIYETNF